MKSLLSVKNLIIMVFLVVSLTACGGGGGGGGGGSSSGISYTGITTLAEINENNAVDLSVNAYEGGQIGSTLPSGLGAVQEGNGDVDINVPMFHVVRVLEASLLKVDVISVSNDISLGAVVTVSETIYGDYGGSASMAIEADDQTGEFSGEFIFSNYSDDGIITMSGSTNFFGVIDVESEEFVEFSFSFDSLTVISGNDSLTLDGDVSVDYAYPTGTMTMTMLMKENNTNKVYKVEDYVYTEIEESAGVEAELSGKYYDPDYGYVTMSTTVPLIFYYDEDNPSDGVLMMTGKTGSAGGNTKAILTILSSTSYQVEADTNGDGTYDWNSGVLYW